MSEANQLYELTRLMEDKEAMESDFSEIFITLRDLLQKKYINKLHHVVETQERHVKEHPPREVMLLRALREFTGDGQRGGFDKMIEMATLMNTATHMRKDLVAMAEQSKPTYRVEGGFHAMENGSENLPSSIGATNLLLAMALLKII